MSLAFFRLAEFSGEGEKKDGPKTPKTSDLVHTPLADRFDKLQHAENAWMKKV